MHQHITINGKTYTAEEAPLLKDRFASEYGEDSFMASLGGFLAEWYNESPLLKVQPYGGYSMRTPFAGHNRNTGLCSHDTDAGIQLTATYGRQRKTDADPASHNRRRSYRQKYGRRTEIFPQRSMEHIRND